MVKKKYSAAEKQAFKAGKAYATAKAGKRVTGLSAAQKKSFRNGVKAVRGKRK